MKLSYRRMSVLLVDSLPAALDTLEAALEPFDFHRLWRTYSAEEALAALAKRKVNLMICAAKLPQVTGLQLLEKVRAQERLAAVAVLITTEKREKLEEEEVRAKGAAGLVTMPLEAQTLRGIVEQTLEHMINPVEEEFLQQMSAARLAMRKGDMGGAEKAYRAAAAAKSDEDANLNLGKLLKAKGDLQGAEEAFVAALKANPSSLRAYLGLAEVYQTMGRLPEALKVLAAAVNAAKRLKASGEVRATLFFYMGELELELKRLQEAMGLFEQASQAAPDDPRLQAKIGDALAAAGFPAESEEFYLRALEMDPDLAHVYNRLAIAYRRQGKLELALNLFRKAQAFHPEDEHLLYNIARCHWEMADYHCAAEELGKALKANPDFKEATHLLDIVLRKAGFAVKSKGRGQAKARALGQGGPEDKAGGKGEGEPEAQVQDQAQPQEAAEAKTKDPG